ncbi:MAG: sulfatase-like hydrolase/transferase, partial [Akkermansiaceae bacterium]
MAIFRPQQPDGERLQLKVIGSMTPTLKIHLNGWSLLDEGDPSTEEGLRTHLSLIKEAGFHGYSWFANTPLLKELIAEYDLRFGGAFDADKMEQFAPAIAEIMEIDNGPINCQLADDDTPVEEAIELAVELMAEAKRQNAPVHLEVHRDTCTETPEKTSAIIEGFRAATGEDTLMNFDFSHPAVMKHIMAKDYINRLLTPRSFRSSRSQPSGTFAPSTVNTVRSPSPMAKATSRPNTKPADPSFAKPSERGYKAPDQPMNCGSFPKSAPPQNTSSAVSPTSGRTRCFLEKTSKRSGPRNWKPDPSDTLLIRLTFPSDKTSPRSQHPFLLMIRRSLLTLVLALSISSANAAERPNVIFVLADDLGIGDVSPTNPDCKIKTPHLQKMADEGITFLDAHSSSSVCTPTRYGVLTGRYNWRSRLARGVLSGTSNHLIPAERATVAHLLSKGGYHTQMIGKWHLGWDWPKAPADKKLWKNIDFTQPVKNGPDINGFKNYYGHCGSLDMAPYVWVDTGKVTMVPNRQEGVTKKEDPYGWYRKGPISDDFVIEDVLPHLFKKSTDYINARAGDAKNGKPFFLYLPLPAPHTPIVPVPPFKDASGINPYADFMMQVDHHMGELFEALKKAGVDDNTIVFFTSDNGCSPEGNFEVLKKHGHDPSAGFRGHKADIYEGGHRVPLIVRWPAKIKGGQKTNAIACLTDFYATMSDITGQNGDKGGEDSFSLVPAFEGKPSTDRQSLISHSIGGSFSIRQGDWKLCLSAGSGGWSAPREQEARKQKLPPL